MRRNSVAILIGGIVFALSSSGCILSGTAKSPSVTSLIKGQSQDSSSHYYIQAVPFVRQKGNLCGPAAISSIFEYYGKNIPQEEIARALYLVPVHGVLNIDLEQYAREKGFWTYVSFDKNLAEIKKNIRNNIPVLALLNAPSIPFKKTYHYVVAIGYDDEEAVFIVNSGTQANETIPYNKFLKNWQLADFWTLVICPKERIDWQLDGQGYINLGFLYEKEGDLESAIENYKKAFEEDKNEGALFNLGNVHLKKGEYKEAIAYYEEAVKLNPDFADCYNNLAYTYMEENIDMDKAIGYAEKALHLKPANKAYYLDTLGMIQFKKGMLNEAVKSLEEASESAADKEIASLIYYHLGLAKLKAGLIDEAKKVLQKSIEINPQSKAKEALEGIL